MVGLHSPQLDHTRTNLAPVVLTCRSLTPPLDDQRPENKSVSSPIVSREGVGVAPSSHKWRRRSKVSTTQREVSESGSEAAASGGAVEQAQEKVGAGVEQAKSSAGSLIRSQVDERSSQLGEQLHGAVQALRQAEQTMEQEGTPGSQLVERAAAEVERTARYLSESDGRRVLNDLEGVGRRNPWAVIGGGIVLGFLGARFLKASSSRRFEEYRKTYESSWAPQPLPSGEPVSHYTGSSA